MPKRFEFQEHTADVKFVAYGSDLEECFSNAAIAAFEVMTQTAKVRPRVEIKVSVSDQDRKTLLYKWLECLIHLLSAKGFLLHEVREISIKGSRLQAVLAGDVQDGSYETHGEVKAVTYNDMEIHENPYWVRVVLDI